MIKARRLWMMGILSLLAFVFLVARLGYLQLYCHAALTERAERERSPHGVQPIERGAILDRSGNVLAISIQGGACFADPVLIHHPDETARVLAPLLHLPTSAIKSKLLERRRFVWLARRLDPETTEALQSLRQPGISVVPEAKRFYPEESLAAQVLGVVGDGQEGLSGVELVADQWLKGQTTPFLFKQWPLSKTGNSFGDKSDEPANSVVLTIDRTLQYIVEQELATQMKLSRPKSGTVIIQDPETGEILAMASAPSFNPNQWGVPGQAQEADTPELLKNPAVEKVMEPGSTFKIVAAAAALEERLVSPNDNFFCENGVWEIHGRTIHDHEKDGWLTFTDVISHSSNIGTAKVGLKIGESGLYRYARAFGFGMPTGLGLPGDGTGILRAPSEWHGASLATISFGQEVGVTPLQMVNAYSVIANSGYLMEPRIYKGIVDEHGQYHAWAPRKPIRRVISMRTVVMLRQILKEVVEHGTGKTAQVVGVATAGKTGTAQKIDPRTHQYSTDRYIASFCGFAPVNHPRLVVGIFLDEPQGTYWGGSEAAPLFSRIIRDAAPYFHLEAESVGPLATLRMVDRS